MSREQMNEFIKPVLAIKPQQSGASVTGDGIDVRKYEKGLVVVKTGAPDAGTFSLVAKVQESSDDGVVDAYADISGKTVTITSDDTVGYIPLFLQGNKRYIRVVFTTALAGGASYVEADATLLLAEEHNLPIS